MIGSLILVKIKSISTYLTQKMTLVKIKAFSEQLLESKYEERTQFE